jgi:cytochrome c biogenesis protein CcmG/thiol:disulfide interchange protein DsbE
VNWKRATIALVAIAPVIALFAFGFTRNPRDIPSPLPGRQAPPFTLVVMSPPAGQTTPAAGDTIKLKGLEGKVVVLNFFASWCLPCRAEHAALSETATKYAGREAQFLGVLYNDEPAAGLRWIAEMGGMTYPALLDHDSRTAIDYGLYGVPETFIIAPDGRVAHKETGPVTTALLERVIDSVLVDSKADKAR